GDGHQREDERELARRETEHFEYLQLRFGPYTGARGRVPSRGYDRRMRFNVVLFDLDGTVIDSGAIILASMRHAAKEVLGAEVPDEALMGAVGGPGLEAQMHALAPDRVEELVTVYPAHNEPLHEQLWCCPRVA